jgi:anti-sigma factor (TIGR02949 family)
MTADPPDPKDAYSCDEVLRRLDDFVDRALSEAEIRRVEDHLAECVGCATAARFERALIDGIRARLRRIAVPAELRRAIHTRLLTESLNLDGRPGLPSGGP